MMSRNEVYILLGTNLGSRVENLKTANNFIDKEIGSILKKSKIYETEPWGVLDQPNFLNQVIKIDSKLNPEKTLNTCLSIEEKMGRERLRKWGERLIDIDLLFYNNLIINTLKLELPHPRLHLRNFTLVPMEEIAPNFSHPILKKSMFDLLENCRDNQSVFELSD